MSARNFFLLLLFSVHTFITTAQDFNNDISLSKIKLFFETNKIAKDTTEWGFTVVHVDSIFLKEQLKYIDLATYKLSNIYKTTEEDDPHNKGFSGHYALDLIENNAYSYQKFYVKYQDLLKKIKSLQLFLVGFYVVDNVAPVKHKTDTLSNHEQAKSMLRIVNSKNLEPLPFVNIGIKDKNVGTISDTKGEFSLSTFRNYDDEKVTFSCIGFETKTVDLLSLMQDIDGIIELDEVPYTLDKVLITVKNKSKYKIKTLGVKTKTFNNSGYIYGKGAGAEISKFISNEEEVLIQSISIYIGNNSKERFTLRGNIYAAKENNMGPSNNLLDRQILLTSDIKSGWLTHELEQPIRTSDSFHIAFEWISKDVKNPMIGLSRSRFDKNTSFQRSISQGKWILSKDFNWAIKCKVMVQK